ncbi:MAG: glycerate kinase [Geobacteraceae bacterium]|nr:glycerate kinase [Geobacteraceae bacterium]
MSNAENITRKIFASALDAADPAKAVERQCERIRSVYRYGSFSRLLVIGFGKASVPMARAMEENLGDLITGGAVVTKYEHGSRHGLTNICVHEAGHPIPDENGLNGTEALLELANIADEKTLVVVLISGGGSALFVSPFQGIALEEKQETTSLLLKAGAEIHELNTVRKHISRVKGGRLAEILRPALSVSLILSDVIGDSLDVIASGPTSPDSTTFADALYILVKYDLAERAPMSVINLLEKGLRGLVPDTPKKGSPIFHKVENVIIGSNRLALDAAKRSADAMGMRSEILSAEISGEAAQAGRKLAAKALAAKRGKGNGSPVCLVSGGETTVTVTGAGIGGRNMELALAFAAEIEGIHGITLLSAGTDGTDGPTDAAGAIVDGMTVTRAKSLGLDPDEYLRNNDSYNFFLKCGGLFVTGPTGTNVMDIQIVVIE